MYTNKANNKQYILISYLFSGNMDKETFQGLVPDTQCPILVVMDNHDSHLSLEVLEKAMKERVNS